MAYIFEYNNTIYQAMNLDKKLKRLKIDKSDVKILVDKELSQSELEKEYLLYTQPPTIEETPKDVSERYMFYNSRTRETIISIYSNLQDLRHIINIDEYERIE